MGLDIAGAFDSASHQRLVDTLLYNKVPLTVSRFIGVWLTSRAFRIKLNTPIGTVYSK